MSNVFFGADYHFGHEKVCTTFLGHDGRPLRPFSNADEMNEEIVRRHNERVSKKDTTYILGDVVIDPKHLYHLHRMNGRKILIPGNHDKLPISRYAEWFDDVEVYKVFKTSGTYERFVCTHVPLHPDHLRWGANVHGHLHHEVVRADGKPDPRYLCVSLEHTDYVPLSLEEVRARLEDGPKALLSAFNN